MRNYQLIIEKGIEKGLQQWRQMLVHRVQKRFPILAPLAQEQAAQIKDMEVLRNVIETVIDTETIEEVRRAQQEAHRSTTS